MECLDNFQSFFVKGQTYVIGIANTIRRSVSQFFYKFVIVDGVKFPKIWTVRVMFLQKSFQFVRNPRSRFTIREVKNFFASAQLIVLDVPVFAKLTKTVRIVRIDTHHPLTFRQVQEFIARVRQEFINDDLVLFKFAQYFFQIDGLVLVLDHKVDEVALQMEIRHGLPDKRPGSLLDDLTLAEIIKCARTVRTIVCRTFESAFRSNLLEDSSLQDDKRIHCKCK